VIVIGGERVCVMIEEREGESPKGEKWNWLVEGERNLGERNLRARSE
jgi:hypothetical protein